LARVGAFLYVRKTPAEDLHAVAWRCRDALASLAAKQLERTQTVERDGFVLFLFGKRLVRHAPQLVQLPGGDFAAATGTLLYKGSFGERALRLIYEDFGSGELFDEAYGSYAVLLRKNGVLSCFNDYFGTYQLYSDARGDVVSSSFIAAARMLPRARVCEQALYEYVFDAAGYGTDTLVQGISRLDPAELLQLQPQLGAVRKRCRLEQAEPPAGFDAQVDAANAELVRYFKTLRAGFGDSMLLGLSGGYDSRLLLAAALEAGAAPRLFVGGRAASADVQVAQALAAQTGLELSHLDTASLPAAPLERFPALVRERLEHYDGVGIRGAVNDGEEYLWRLRRMAGPLVEINGGGGEIFRDFWKLPARDIALTHFVAKVLEFKSLDKIAATTRRFDRARYRERLAGKLRASLRSEAATMSPRQVASLYTILRSTAFAAPAVKELNLLAYSVLPFAEARLALPSWRIPLRWRCYGRFESEMIRRLSPALAACPSSYGHRFSDPLPLAKRLRESLDRHCRSIVPLPLLFFAYSRLRKPNQYNSAPHYYSERYLQSILDPAKLWIGEYFDLPRLLALDDPHIVSRALSAELTFQLLARKDEAVELRAA
jgi:hypothetical protein